MMKTIKFLSVSIVLFALCSCSSNKKQEEQSNETKTEVTDAIQKEAKVNVYYYHGERRCATCKAVGRVAEETIKENFTDAKLVQFKDVNVELEENAELVKKYELSGSGLIICWGNSKEDLTAFAFQNALNNPEKLKEKLSETIKTNI